MAESESPGYLLKMHNVCPGRAIGPSVGLRINALVDSSMLCTIAVPKPGLGDARDASIHFLVPSLSTGLCAAVLDRFFSCPILCNYFSGKRDSM